ncbi:hypothetical protein DFJ63DRAFT_312385 [Scheffersomyces coipomensis]|uniref:uncharacterized protein n=1 Tax=Scheffersomyces coipomensis TaxID=1788519 RepID=UPI00315DFCDA
MLIIFILSLLLWYNFSRGGYVLEPVENPTGAVAGSSVLLAEIGYNFEVFQTGYVVDNIVKFPDVAVKMVNYTLLDQLLDNKKAFSPKIYKFLISIKTRKRSP